MGPSQRQEAVKALQRSGLRLREAFAIVRARRRPPREQYGIRAAQDKPLISRLTQLAQEHPRYGCKRLYVIYERQASELENYKRFRRLYRLGNLQIARRRRRSRAKYVRGQARSRPRPWCMNRPPSPNDYVFRTARGEPFSASHVRNEWARARVRLGLEASVRFYNLRHAHATALLAAGNPVKIVSDRLGHVRAELALDTYCHVHPGMQSGAVDTVAKLFAGLDALQNCPPAPAAKNVKSAKR